MNEPALGTTTVTQVGIIVRDIEAKARAWSEVLGLPMPQIQVTDTVDIARTEYEGEPTYARAKLAFFHMGQVDIELIEPVGEPSTWKDQLDRHGDSLHHIAFLHREFVKRGLVNFQIRRRQGRRREFRRGVESGSAGLF